MILGKPSLRTTVIFNLRNCAFEFIVRQIKQIRSWTVTSTTVKIMYTRLRLLKRVIIYGISAIIIEIILCRQSNTTCSVIERLLIFTLLLYFSSSFVIPKILKIAKIVTAVLLKDILNQKAFVIVSQKPEYHSKSSVELLL